jgi:hypothetical protein
MLGLLLGLTLGDKEALMLAEGETETETDGDIEGDTLIETLGL